MSDKNIYQRINAVMKVVEYVQKDATVSTGGGSYKAVSHDMVLAVLRKEMVSHGIVVRVEQLHSAMLQMQDKKNDIKQHLYSGDYAIPDCDGQRTRCRQSRQGTRQGDELRCKVRHAQDLRA